MLIHKIIHGHSNVFFKEECNVLKNYHKVLNPFHSILYRCVFPVSQHVLGFTLDLQTQFKKKKVLFLINISDDKWELGYL